MIVWSGRGRVVSHIVVLGLLQRHQLSLLSIRKLWEGRGGRAGPEVLHSGRSSWKRVQSLQTEIQNCWLSVISKKKSRNNVERSNKKELEARDSRLAAY